MLKYRNKFVTNNNHEILNSYTHLLLNSIDMCKSQITKSSTVQLAAVCTHTASCVVSQVTLTQQAVLAVDSQVTLTQQAVLTVKLHSHSRLS